MRNLCQAALAIGLFLPNIVSMANAETVSVRRFALLVGANNGGPSRVRLAYAETDARSMATILTELGGVSSLDTVLLVDPSAAELDEAFSILSERIKHAENERTELIFYYSGHSDEDGLMLGAEEVAYKEIRAQLETLPAKVRIGILDSCSSGAMVRGKGGTRRSPFLVDSSSRVEGYAILTSSSADEAAQEADRIQGSYFTHYLISGLRGAADHSKDGVVTLNEAYEYAFHATLAETERTSYGPQHPNYDIQMAGAGDLVLTDLRATSAGLAISASIEGRTFVRNGRGDLVAELEKLPGQPVELGLAPGEYTVVVRSKEHFGEKSVRLGEGDRLSIELEDLKWSKGAVAVARGDSEEDLSELLDIDEQLYVEDKALASRGLLIGETLPVVDSTFFDFNFVYGKAEKLRGVSMGFGANKVEYDGFGLMMGLGSNQVNEDFHGVQISAGANVVGKIDGSTKGMGGVQLALGANAVGGDFSGYQGALGFNGGSAHVRGFQWSQGVNYAGELHGIQAGLINIAKGQSGGFQAGIVNIGPNMSGVQLGIVNIAGENSIPIGIINVSKEGRHNLSIAASEGDILNISYKMGSKRTHNIFAIGGVPDDHFYAAYGFGGEIDLGQLVWMDIDALCSSYSEWGENKTIAIVPSVELIFGIKMSKHFKPFVGTSYNFWIPIEGNNIIKPDGLLTTNMNGVLGWPGFQAGIEF